MTAQIMDHLTFAGNSYSLASEPLRTWLLRRKNRHISFGRRSRSTANRRGYSSGWEVIDRKLYLTRFKAQNPDGSDMGLTDLFPKSVGPVFAEWFSGGLRCPMGKPLELNHVGYSTVYEYDLILWFIEGVLVEPRLNMNREYVNLILQDDDPLDVEGELEDKTMAEVVSAPPTKSAATRTRKSKLP
jgi:hypothetical protein